MEGKRMLFSEIYSCYFQVMAEILEEAVQKKLTKKKMTEMIQKKAFSESSIAILEALQSEEWPLITKDFRTPIQKIPTQPLTMLQKRWMKALLLDKRIHLFAPDSSGLEDIKPLYEPSMFVYYDQFRDGDSYENPTYIKNFHTILQAAETGKGLQIKFSGRTGWKHEMTGILQKIEYSAKDDKFRIKILPVNAKYEGIAEINLARVEQCELVDVEFPSDLKRDEMIREKKSVKLDLTDERDALRRAMLHFSYLEKETVQLDDKKYRITIHYDRNDENELLIQILSFGPLIKVVEPMEFRNKIRERIQKQKNYNKRRNVYGGNNHERSIK